MKKVILNVPEEVASEFATELNALMQRYEVMQEYVPQEGDFVAFKDDSTEAPFIGIFASRYNSESDKIVCYAHIKDNGILGEEEEYWNADTLRQATETEKQNLLRELARSGKRWNEEECKFERAEPYEVIRTVADAIAATGIQMPESINGLADDIVAYLKLRIVVAAINGLKADTLNEWPRYTADEWRYWPWFNLLDEEKVAGLTPEEKRRVVGRANGSANASGGCVYASAHFGSASSHTSLGGRLSFKSFEAAHYCARQFAELWADFYGIKIVK